MTTNKKMDKNNKEIKTGDIVKIEGGFFKSDNGIFKVITSPGDEGWSGSDYWIKRLNKNGTFSKSKYSGQFWPLMVTVSSREKSLEAREHNEKNATITVLSEDLQQVKKIREVQEIAKSKLIDEGVEKVREENGYYKGYKLHDIVEELTNYGLSYEDAKKEIMELYDQQQTTTKPEPQTEEVEAISAICAGCLNYKKDCNGMTNHFTGCIYYTVKEKQKEKTEATPEQAEENNRLKVEISYNEEKNGIEIKFDGKPEREVLENLKAYGFRWSRFQKIWYAKDTEARRNFIKQFDAVETESEPKIFEYPEINIDDLEDYTVDPELSKRENDGNWIFRTKERDHNQELQETLKHYQDLAIKVLSKAKDKEITYYLKRDLQRFKKAYYSNYIAILTNKANNPSWAVTGRAGRNARQDQKASDRYSRLLGESTEVVDRFKKSLSRAESKMLADARKENYKNIENTDIEIGFKVENKEIEYLRVKEKVRTYNHKNYMIAKLWGSYKIFKDGEELPREIVDLRTTDTLNTAKKALQLIINEEIQGVEEAI